MENGRAGKLDTLVELQTSVEAQTSSGEVLKTWAMLRRAWAGVSDLGLSERFSAARTISPDAKTFTVRWFDGIETTERIVHAGDNYDILAVREIGGRRKWIALTAEVIE